MYKEPINENTFQNQQVQAKDVFDLHHYKPLKKYIMMLGLNPYSETRGSKIRQNVVVYTIVMAIIPLFLELCVVIRDKDFDGIIDQVPHLLLAVISLIKLENILLNRKRIKILLNFILNDWKILIDELPVLEKTTAQGSKLAHYYRVTLLWATICFIYIPLINPTLDLIIPLNETRPREQLFGVCYVFISADDHFTGVFLHLGWCTWVTVYNVATVDSLYIVIIHHVCGLFDVCGYQIQMALENNKLQYHQFKQCVMTHHKALEFFNYLQNCTQNMFLLVVAMNMILISMTAVQILMHIDRPLDSSRFVVFFICAQFHLYVVSLFGQSILNNSALLAEKIYSANWYEVPIKFQKLLCFMIVRSNKPCILSAGGLYDMNMENYGKAVKACMSYFTMFLSMRE